MERPMIKNPVGCGFAFIQAESSPQGGHLALNYHKRLCLKLFGYSLNYFVMLYGWFKA